jgi:eukaryotic-like serine/threonine-protein kinase
MTDHTILSRWDEVDALFTAALDRPAAERTAFVEARTAGDAELRTAVLSLLASADDGAFDTHGGPLTRELMARALAALEEPYAEQFTGKQVGRYRLLRELGRGGAGSVFLAERDDGAFQQRVAVKLLRRGLDADDILARFRMERQILASLNHPHIARLLDGGATEDGRPYLVMELVEGQPITAWCDAQRHSIDERLDLFADVAAAVDYAHRNLIVHRDLKPSNILVTADGTVKLLDFGIAKLLDDSANAAVLTRTGFHVMTPEYASPEQVRGAAITTASDVYQLGLILYELCTGGRPQRDDHDTTASTLPPSAAVARTANRAATPNAPSADAVPTHIAHCRRTDAGRLRARLRGDIDTIVLKAMRTEPERRYRSVQELAADIRRHRTGHAILARPDEWSYRTSRFLSRHRAAAIGAAAAIVALFGYGATLVVQAQRLQVERNSARAEAERADGERAAAERAQVTAEGERNRAQLEFDRAEAEAEHASAARLMAELDRDRAAREAAKAARVTEFLVGLFDAADPATARGAEVSARELLEQGVAQADQLAAEPAVQAELLAVMARVHRALGSYDDARQLTERTLALRRTLDGPRSIGVADALNDLAVVLRQQGDMAGAEARHREALALRRTLLGREHIDIAESLSNLAIVLRTRGDLAGAEDAHREALAMQRRLLGPTHPGVARTLNNLAVVLRQKGDLAGAEQMHRDALSIRRRTLGSDHPDLAQSLSNLGIVVRARGDLAEAETLHREALDIQKKVLPADHPDIAASLSNLGLVLRDRADLAGAEAVNREALQLLRAQHGDAHPSVAQTLNNLAVLLRQRGNIDGAEAAHREALGIRRTLFGAQHPLVASSLNNLGQVLRARGDHAGAEGMHREALAIYRALLGDDHPDVAQTLNNLGMVLGEKGDLDAAEAFHRDALAVRRRLLNPHHPDIVQSLVNLSVVLRDRRDYTGAETALREALASTMELYGEAHPRVTTIRAALDDVIARRAAGG